MYQIDPGFLERYFIFQVHVKDDGQAGKKKLADGWGKMAAGKSGTQYARIGIL